MTLRRQGFPGCTSRRAALQAVAVLVGSGGAWAADPYPNRPIRLISSLAAGGVLGAVPMTLDNPTYTRYMHQAYEREGQLLARLGLKGGGK